MVQLQVWQESAHIDGNYFVIAPGGGETWGDNAKYKRWPEGHFASLAKHFLSREDRTVVLMAGPGDEAICESIRKDLPEERVRMVCEPDLITNRNSNRRTFSILS